MVTHRWKGNRQLPVVKRYRVTLEYLYSHVFSEIRFSEAEYRNRTGDERLETFSFASKLIPQEGRLLSLHFLHTRDSI